MSRAKDIANELYGLAKHDGIIANDIRLYLSGDYADLNELLVNIIMYQSVVIRELRSELTGRIMMDRGGGC
jgi:hypothetical protein